MKKTIYRTQSSFLGWERYTTSLLGSQRVSLSTPGALYKLNSCFSFIF